MASLFDQIKQNAKIMKRGSQLFEAAPDSLANQVKRQGGLPGSVVSPEAAVGLGLTQDQAKMAGSSAQLQKAVRESVEPDRQMARQMPTRTTATQEEQAAKAKAEQASRLEGLGARVGGLVKGYLEETAKTAQLAKPKADLTKIKNDFPSLTEAQIAKVQSAIETGTIDAELWTIFPQAKSAEELTTALAKYNAAQKEIVTTNLKDTFGPNVTLAQLKPDDYAALGLQGLGDIASILGRPESELRGMSIDEFQSAISNLMQQDFDRVEELSRIANDAFYPANVRQSAQAELRALSSAGVQATEADMQQLNESIQSADTITVGDEEMTVAELLSDEGMTSVVTSYLDDKKGDYQALIKEQFPALAQFIEQNKQALKKAADNLADSVKTSANIQQSNAKIQTATDANVPMTDFNKVAFGSEYDPTKPTNTDWSLRKTEAHKILDSETKEFSSEEKADYARFLNEMARLNPELLKSGYMNLNAAQLRAKIPSGMSFRDYLRQTKDFQVNVKNLADPNLSPERALYSAFGDDSGDNFRNFVDSYRQYALSRELGYADIPENQKAILSVLDGVMADGKVDAAELAGVRAKLAGFLQSGYRIEDNKSLFDMVKDVGSSLTANTVGVLWGLVKDGVVSAEDAAQIVELKETDQISRLYDKLNAQGLTVEGGVRERLESNLTERAKLTMNDQLSKRGVNVAALNQGQANLEQYLKGLGKGFVSRAILDKLSTEFNRLSNEEKILTQAANEATGFSKQYLNNLLAVSQNLRQEINKLYQESQAIYSQSQEDYSRAWDIEESRGRG